MTTATHNTRRFGILAGLLAAACLAFGASPALGAQQVDMFDGGTFDTAGNPFTQAGGHPDEASTTLFVRPRNFTPRGTIFARERLNDVVVELPPGLVGNPRATTACSAATFASSGLIAKCPLESQVGIFSVGLGNTNLIGGLHTPIWNLGAAAGTPAVLGINIVNVITYFSAGVRTGDDYGVDVSIENINVAANVIGSKFTIWGKPQDSANDTRRTFLCAAPTSNCPPRPTSAPNVPFFTLPTTCGAGPLVTDISANSWETSEEYAEASFLSHDNTGPIPNPIGVDACNSLDFSPTLEARPTTTVGDSASGLDVDLRTPQNQLPNGTAEAHLRDSVVTLPEGLVLNPGAANGLGTCDLNQIGFKGGGNEEQTIDLTGIGPFSLTFEGETTATIPGDADAAAVQAALGALPNLGAGDVEVTGSANSFTVEFTGARAGQDVALLSADGMTDKIQRVAVDATSGVYSLTYGASTTDGRGANFDGNALFRSRVIEFDLNGLDDVLTAGGSVSVTGGPPDAGATHPFYVFFDGGAFSGTDQSIVANNVSLSGGGASITVTDVQAAGLPVSGNVIVTKRAGHLTFTPGAHDCPDAARVASMEIDTPLLDHVLRGSAYLADPFDNPFDRLLALYLTANDVKTGIGVKLAGHVELDPNTGQVTAIFEDNPQVPFEHLRLHFFGGSTGNLRTPSICGDHTTTSSLTPWSAPDSGPPAETEDTWQITQNCSGSEAGKPHAPFFDAGAVSPIAGAHTPFVVKLRREDGSQNFSAVTVKPPAGLTAKLAGTPACSDAALNAAANKAGKAEEASPSCPAASEIGRVIAGAGAGPAPYYAHGRVYLAGPYKGAPISLATIIPATAGPFDLGTVVTRIAAHINPATAEITAESDPLPTILDGIPLDVRTVDVVLDKPEFSKTGTNCDPLAVSGLLTSTVGALANLEARYQLGECTSLGFKPSMAIRLKGGTKRGKYPQLTAYVLPRSGDANIRSVSVSFPRSEFLANEHIRTICTRPQFAADQCPAGSIYGTSTVYTPLLDYPLTGNVHLRSSDNLLPDVVPDLRGPAYQPIKVEAAGRTDSIRGGIRNTFDYFPDAPFSRAVLKMQGGSKGLLVNSRNICARTYRAVVRFTSHSGDEITRRPKVKAQCKNSKRKKKSRGHKRSKRAAKRVALSARAGVR